MRSDPTPPRRAFARDAKSSDVAELLVDAEEEAEDDPDALRAAEAAEAAAGAAPSASPIVTPGEASAEAMNAGLS